MLPQSYEDAVDAVPGSLPLHQRLYAVSYVRTLDVSLGAHKRPAVPCPAVVTPLRNCKRVTRDA